MLAPLHQAQFGSQRADLRQEFVVVGLRHLDHSLPRLCILLLHGVYDDADEKVQHHDARDVAEDGELTKAELRDP